MSEVKLYIPDLEKIAHHSEDREPLMLTEHEYDAVLRKQGLARGARLSDVGILKCMEEGLIKIWSPEKKVDVMNLVQPAAIDFTLGNESWHYREGEISRLTFGKHKEYLEDLDLLVYTYKVDGDVFVFHPGRLVLGLSDQGVSLSNVVIGDFDGRSSAARLGLSNHQTAGRFDPGFAGLVMMEFSNANAVDIAVPIHEPIGSMGFTLLGEPSSRPRSTKKDSLSKAQFQVSPFGYRDPEWDVIKKHALGRGNGHTHRDYFVSGDPSQKLGS